MVKYGQVMLNMVPPGNSQLLLSGILSGLVAVMSRVWAVKRQQRLRRVFLAGEGVVSHQVLKQIQG